MNKIELIEKIHNRTGIPRNTTKKCILEIIELVTESLANQRDVHFVNFGTFKAIHYDARQYTVPQKNNSVHKPEGERVKFNASVNFFRTKRSFDR